jgi:hypothetical protein
VLSVLLESLGNSSHQKVLGENQEVVAEEVAGVAVLS